MAATAGYSKRPRLDKLGVKPDARVAVLKLDDPHFRRELERRTTDLVFTRPRNDSDIIIFNVLEKRELTRLSGLKAKLKSNGAIWVLWRKGRRELKESDVRSAALDVGLVDVKVAAFSDVLSALKLVIPVAQR
jgi:hypothetical protein